MLKFQYSAKGALEQKGDVLAIIVHAGDHGSTFSAADRALKGALAKQAEAEGFSGKSGQTLTASGLGFRLIMLVGAGEHGEFAAPDLRGLGARVSKFAKGKRAKKVVVALPPLSASEVEDGLYFAALGAELGLYVFDKYKKPANGKKHAVASLTLSLANRGKTATSLARPARGILERAQVIGAAVCRARNYVNEPAGFMTPSQMVKEARSIARSAQVTAKILGRKECEKLGMGMFLAVGRGSVEEPKFIHLTYKPKKRAKKRIAIVGKGVMFDSGGYSLKPSAAMLDMKIDMAGSAAVMGTMAAIAELGSPYEIHAIAACCENMVSGGAYRLGDVLRAMDGTTVEINNTDAEGRLTLGDAITYARDKVKADEIFDFATLTGACMIALGNYTAGVMSHDEDLAKSWLECADSAGEDMWRLPLNPKLKKQLKSPIADMKNTGERYGGALTAGWFLSNFAKDTPWVHVDLAGPAHAGSQGADPSIPRGGTGFAVQTLVRYLTN